MNFLGFCSSLERKQCVLGPRMPLETKRVSTLGRVPRCHEFTETVLEVFAQVSVLHISNTALLKAPVGFPTCSGSI